MDPITAAIVGGALIGEGVNTYNSNEERSDLIAGHYDLTTANYNNTRDDAKLALLNADTRAYDALSHAFISTSVMVPFVTQSIKAITGIDINFPSFNGPTYDTNTKQIVDNNAPSIANSYFKHDASTGKTTLIDSETSKPWVTNFTGDYVRKDDLTYGMSQAFNYFQQLKQDRIDTYDFKSTNQKVAEAKAAKEKETEEFSSIQTAGEAFKFKPGMKFTPSYESTQI